MATDTAELTADNLSALTRGIMNDLEELVSQQFNLVRREMGDELKKAGIAGLSLSGGAGATVAGGLMGTLSLVYFLHEVFGLPLWLSYAITGCGCCAAGASLISAGVHEVSHVNLLPGHSSRERESRSADRRVPSAAQV